MGVLRTILALLVVGSHLHAFGGAAFAVKSFFIISGFYMALVINTRYWALPVSSFYASRLLRLLPLYWVIGLLTLIAEIVLVPRGQYFDRLASPLAYGAGLDLASLPLPIILYIGLSLTTMLGLDTGLWIGFDRVNGALSFAPDFAPGVTSVVALNPVPQGWTIGLELLFYALAPFIVRRSIWLIGSLCVVSLAFRLALIALGFSGEPWNRALLPSELIYFLLGVLGYRLYVVIPRLKSFRAHGEFVRACSAGARHNLLAGGAFHSWQFDLGRLEHNSLSFDCRRHSISVQADQGQRARCQYRRVVLSDLHVPRPRSRIDHLVAAQPRAVYWLRVAALYFQHRTGGRRGVLL